MTDNSHAPEHEPHALGSWIRTRKDKLLSGVLTMTIALTLVALGIVIGARVIAPSGAVFEDRPTYSMDDVLDLIDSVGVECAAPLVMIDRDDGVFGSCTSDPRFDLHVSESVAKSYESFDLATQLGCHTVGDIPHTQWFVARSSNWNLLTHSRTTADALARLVAVTITAGGCDIASNGLA